MILGGASLVGAFTEGLTPDLVVGLSDWLTLARLSALSSALAIGAKPNIAEPAMRIAATMRVGWDCFTLVLLVGWNVSPSLVMLDWLVKCLLTGG